MEVFVNCLRHSHSTGLDIYDATVSTFSLLVLNFSEDFTFFEEENTLSLSLSNRRAHTPGHTDY